jgi:general secretion pathway protein F/MSHA biogenesis protein MshG
MKYFEVDLVINGKKTQEFVKAENKLEAVEVVQNRTGGTILKVIEKEIPLSVKLEELKDKLRENFFKKRINIEEFAVFLRQLGVMTNAGISLREAFREGVASTNDKMIKKIASTAMEDIETGLGLTESFKKFKYEVGVVSIAIISTGEMTGTLAESFQKLADILENIKQNRDNMKKALRMPIISLIVLMFAFVFLVMVVVPKFKGIFAKLGSDLPLPTQVLLTTQSVLSHYGIFMLLFAVFIFFLHKRLHSSNQNYRLKSDKILLKIYLVGTIIKLSQLQRFTMVLAELLKSGITLTAAIDNAVETLENEYLRHKLLFVNDSIQKGSSLAEALEDTGLFERMIIQMIKSGESSGQIDIMLDKVATYYKSKFQMFIDNISAYIEPILMAFVAGMVLLLALGIFLPMWDLASAAKGR